MARIGIDARIFGAQRGGIGRYTEELARALPAYDTHNTFVLFMRDKDMRTFKPRSSRVKKVRADVREYSRAEQTHMPRVIEKARIDLLHAPHVNLPYAYRGPLIVTVHDLIEYKYDRAHSSTLPAVMYRGKRTALRAMLPSMLRRADALITPSLWAKRDMERTIPRLRTPIHVIPHGKPRLARHTNSSPVSFPYAIYVGSAAPHKNVARLLYAFNACVSRNLIHEHMILIMPEDAHTQSVRESVIHRFPRAVQERIHIISGISDRELSSYIYHAVLLCSASREEGYGLPFAEALAHGTPVLGSFVGVLPELGGVHVAYWDERHTTAMARALIRALHHPPHPPKIILPSWRRVAQQHIALYTSHLR